MGARGKHKKGNNRQHKNKTGKVRKKYSLYSNNKQNKFKVQEKRKFDNENLDNIPKKLKVMENTPPLDESLSSESEDELDYMMQLRSTFKDVKRDNVIESSDDTEESDDEKGFDNSSESNKQHLDVNVSANTNNDEENTNASEIEKGEEASQEDDLDPVDPFAKHLFYELNESLLNSVQSAPMNVSSFTEEWPQLGTLIIQIPKCSEEKPEKKQCSIVEEKFFVPAGKVPKHILLSKDTLETLCIKSQISHNLVKSNTSLVIKDKPIPLTPLQAEIFSVINNYQDLYFSQRTFDNSEEIRYVYCLHSINHILKTRMKVIRHNSRLSRKDDVPEEFRDQGLVRPKVGCFFNIFHYNYSIEVKCVFSNNNRNIFLLMQ